MGCQTSRPDNDTHNQGLRRNKKKADKIIGRASVNATISENVVAEEDKISDKDHIKISKIIAPHFFFSSFSENQRAQIIDQMKIYKCPKDQYIFNQTDPGSLFFIIKKGKISIQINNKHVKDMDRGESFGELSLLYTAPRSASVRTLTDCVFWGLHQSVFRSYTQQMVKRNYKIAKPFLQKVPLFQFLSLNQINSIAYSMNSLKYNLNETIFKEGDDANSFYIIIEGEVKIFIRGKDPITLSKGESFGENSFKKLQVRSGTASAGSSGAKLLSIGRQGLLKCLGDNIQELIQYNILKWALKRSKIFANIPNELVKKFIQISEIKQCSDNQIICKKKDVLKHFIVCIDGKVDQYEPGVLINQEYILEATSPDKQILLKNNIKKYDKGNICLLPIKKIQSLLELNLIEVTRKNQDIFRQLGIISIPAAVVSKVKQPKSNFAFNDLMFQKCLGEGQFGRVFLVRNRGGGQKFALKCIKKKAVVEMGLQKLIKNQKQILQTMNHPLIVRMEQTFKDEAFIYLLLQFIDGMDFFDMLREIGLCNHELSCFYMASLILCIQELHSHNIVYRDLKPQNAVVDSKGFLYMIDLGTAKKLSEQKGNRTFTIIGTPHYMAPEIIQGKGYGLQVDIWSLGIILYEMVCGKLPFGEELDDPYMIYKQIMGQKIQYPNYYYNKKGKVLIEKLLQRNSLKRQIQDFEVLKRDPYFQQFKWDDLYNKKMKPPVAPKKKKDSSNNKISQSIGKYLAKDIKAEAVKEPTTWDQIF